MSMPAYSYPTYSPYDDATQPHRYIDRYPKSFTRNPVAPLIERPLTRTELTGPTNLAERLHAGPLDLSRATSASTRATGQLIHVTGRLKDEDGSPLAGAVVELWQANAAGRYIHELDAHPAPLDPGFSGQGRLATNEAGEFSFFTIKPGAYPVLESGWWWRPPHIHFSIFGVSWMDRYVTQIFFPGEPLNETDLLLNGVPDRDVRERLIFEYGGTTIGEVNAISYRRDFVLRGHRRTPDLD